MNGRLKAARAASTAVTVAASHAVSVRPTVVREALQPPRPRDHRIGRQGARSVVEVLCSVLVIGHSGGDVLTGDSSACETTATRLSRAKLHPIQRKTA
jgi:hypothetical protein